MVAVPDRLMPREAAPARSASQPAGRTRLDVRSLFDRIERKACVRASHMETIWERDDPPGGVGRMLGQRLAR
jgi:hypothetical protein